MLKSKKAGCKMAKVVASQKKEVVRRKGKAVSKMSKDARAYFS